MQNTFEQGFFLPSVRPSHRQSPRTAQHARFPTGLAWRLRAVGVSVPAYSNNLTRLVFHPTMVPLSSHESGLSFSMTNLGKLDRYNHKEGRLFSMGVGQRQQGDSSSEDEDHIIPAVPSRNHIKQAKSISEIHNANMQRHQYVSPRKSTVATLCCPTRQRCTVTCFTCDKHG